MSATIAALRGCTFDAQGNILRNGVCIAKLTTHKVVFTAPSSIHATDYTWDGNHYTTDQSIIEVPTNEEREPLVLTLSFNLIPREKRTREPSSHRECDLAVVKPQVATVPDPELGLNLHLDG